jgi:hypothetical protein
MHRKVFKSQPCVLEILEVRKLLSVVNIMDFGAQNDGSQDDSPALNAAMNAAQPGDTIFFPHGTYQFNSTVMLKGDISYVGDNKTYLQGDPSMHIFHISQDNIDIENFTFVGNPIFIDKPDLTMVQNLTINGNAFQTTATGENNNAITFTTGLRDSMITNNSFGPINADNGVYGYNWDNLTIANNEFLNGNEGIHVTDFGNQSQNLTIEQNYFSGLHRMGIELQGGGNHSVVQDNYYENAVMTSDVNQNLSTFAYSIIADQSENNIVRRNTAVDTDRPDGTGVRVGIEIGGTNTLVTDNYIVGTDNVLESNDGNGPSSVLAQNNRWGGYLNGPYGINLTLIHDGPNVDLSWDPGRGRPGPYKELTSNGLINVQKSTDVLVQSLRQQLNLPDAAIIGSDPIYLSQMPWASASSSSGSVAYDQNNAGEPMQIDGTGFDHGVGVAGDSQVVYNLDGQYAQLFSNVGIDDAADNNASADFQVMADGQQIYDSGTMSGRTSAKQLTLDVTGVKQLTLITNGGGDAGDFADWAGAQLTAAAS